MWGPEGAQCGVQRVPSVGSRGCPVWGPEGAQCGVLRVPSVGYWTIFPQEETMDAEEFLKEAVVMKHVRGVMYG